MKKLSAVLVALLMSFSAFAQEIDYQLTGHSTSPFSLNPSSVGEANAYRAGVNYRMQWPTLANEYNTLRLSYDQNFFKLVSSIGVHYVYDSQAKVFKSHELGVTYSHNIRVVEEHYIRLGLTAGMFIKKLGDDMKFTDQWLGGAVANESLENDNLKDKQVFPDFSFGAQYVWENKLSTGFAIYHIAAPSFGFLDDQSMHLDRRYTFHARYLHNLESTAGLWGNRGKVENYIMGTVAYQHQGEYNVANLNVGAFISHLMLGVAYRHDFRRDVLGKLNTVSFMIGGNYKGLQAYYTYDLFTSQKSNGSWSHEFSIVYVFAKKHFRYSCPIVYW